MAGLLPITGRVGTINSEPARLQLGNPYPTATSTPGVLVGSATGQGSLTGGLTVRLPASSVLGHGSLTGTLGLPLSLSGSVKAQGSANGGLTGVFLAMSGVVTAQGSLAAPGLNQIMFGHDAGAERSEMGRSFDNAQAIDVAWLFIRLTATDAAGGVDSGSLFTSVIRSIDSAVGADAVFFSGIVARSFDVGDGYDIQTPVLI